MALTSPIRLQFLVATAAEFATDDFNSRAGFNTTADAWRIKVAGVERVTAMRDASQTFQGLQIFAAGIQDSTLTSGRVMLAGTSGRHQGDAGFTYTQTGGITRILALGDGLVAANVISAVRRTATFYGAFELRDEANFSRWNMRMPAGNTNWALIARTAAGVDIDAPFDVVNASAGLIAIGGSTNRPTQHTGVLSVNVAPRPTQEYIYTHYTSATMQGINAEYAGAGAGVPIITTNSTAFVGASQILIRGRAVGADKFTVNANGDVDIAAAYKTGGVTRISSGGAASFTTLSTTGAATVTGLTDTTRTAGRVLFAGAGGAHADSSSLLWDDTKKEFGVGVSRTIAGSTGATSEGGEVLIASGSYLDGLYCLRWDAPNRVERIWFRVTAHAYDGNPQITVLQYFSYNSAKVFQTLRIRASSDGVTRYISVSVGNLNGSTAVIYVVAKLLDSAAPTGTTIGGTLPGGTTSVKTIVPDNLLGLASTLGADFDGVVTGHVGFAGWGTSANPAYWHIGQGAFDATRVGFASKASGDSFARWLVKENGLQEWGDGAGARDTNLYRSAANVLKTDDSFDALDLRTSGVTRISSGGAGTLVSLSVTGLAGSGSRPLVADAAGAVSAQSAATFLGTIGALSKTGDTGINSASAFQWTGANPRTLIQGGLISVFWGGVSHALNVRSNASSITIMRGGGTGDDSNGGLDFLSGKLAVKTPTATAYDLDVVNGNLQIAGATRISAGGSGSFVDVSATGNFVTPMIGSFGEHRYQTKWTGSNTTKNMTSGTGHYTFTGTSACTFNAGGGVASIVTVFNQTTASLTIGTIGGAGTVNGAATYSLPAGKAAIVIDDGGSQVFAWPSP